MGDIFFNHDRAWSYWSKAAILAVLQHYGDNFCEHAKKFPLKALRIACLEFSRRRRHGTRVVEVYRVCKFTSVKQLDKALKIAMVDCDDVLTKKQIGGL